MDGGLIIFGGIGAAFYLWYLMDQSNEQKAKLEKSLTQIDNFNASQKYLSVDGIKGISFDESNKKVAICALNARKIETKVIDYKDILSVELFYDGTNVTKTNRVSQIGGALIGGLALGASGALVGGLSGKTNSNKEIEKIELRIILNDKEAPIQDIVFLNTKSKKSSYLYQTSEKSARHWHAIFSLLIADTDNGDPQNKVVTTVGIKSKKPQVENMNQINELFQKGILTEDEFTKAKQRVIDNID